MSRSKKLYFRSALRKLKCVREDCQEALDLANEFDKEFRKVWEDVVSRVKTPKKTDGFAELLSEVVKKDAEDAQEEGHSSQADTVKSKEKEDVGAYEKALFRKIAQQTHPDRYLQLGIEDKKLQDEREVLFRRAQTAYENEDIEELLDICLNLDIDVGDINIPYDHLIKKIENLSNAEYNKMSSITSSIAWLWGNAEKNDVKTRISLVKAMICRFGYYEVDDNTIAQVLKEHNYVEEKNEG